MRFTIERWRRALDAAEAEHLDAKGCIAADQLLALADAVGPLVIAQALPMPPPPPPEEPAVTVVSSKPRRR